MMAHPDTDEVLRKLYEEQRKPGYFDRLLASSKAAPSPTTSRPPNRTTSGYAAFDGLDHFRKTGGDKRWGRGISAEDYRKLSTANAIARARALKAGLPWPPATPPTRAEQQRAWSNVGQRAKK